MGVFFNMFIISVVIFLVAPLITWGLHGWLRQKKESNKRSIMILIAYFIFLNACTIAVSSYRGIDMLRWNPFTTTMSFRIKYMAFSTVLGIALAVVLCRYLNKPSFAKVFSLCGSLCKSWFEGWGYKFIFGLDVVAYRTVLHDADIHCNVWLGF